MEKLKTIAEFERERGIMFTRADIDVDKEISEEEYMQMLNDEQFLGVHFEGRTEWLESNDYELTRANYLDTTLKAKEIEE